MNVLTVVNASTAVWRSEHFIRMSVTVCSALIPIAHFTMYTRGVNNFLIHLSLQRRDLQNFVNNSKTIHHRENARNITVCSYFGLSVITISLLLDLYRILFYHCAFSSFFFSSKPRAYEFLRRSFTTIGRFNLFRYDTTQHLQNSKFVRETFEFYFSAILIEFISNRLKFSHGYFFHLVYEIIQRFGFICVSL